ncbi:hypothetical protein [Apilactobacillus quenuiae]|uniref:hypothetical protein n=1 Tax=Apilactobacillus quenuiae TaxID=2008377 RepID=UPI000D01F9A6|nr:hypothetical protein [Apilactobacillus quenuiae]
MKNFKRILCAAFTVTIFASTFSGVAAHADNITGKNEQETNNEIQRLYNQGKSKGIITDEYTPYNQFFQNMKKSLIPSLLC